MSRPFSIQMFATISWMIRLVAARSVMGIGRGDHGHGAALEELSPVHVFTP